MKGWISLHRTIRDHWIWTEGSFDKRSAWIDLLLLANHKARKVSLGNEILFVERGSFITSIRKLGQRWGWSNTKVNAFLTLLEDDEMVSIKKDTKKTVVTICNFNVYQDSNIGEKDTKKTLKEHEKDTKKTQKHTNNNVNNDNNEDNDNNTTKPGSRRHQKIVEKWNDLNVKNIVGINAGSKREIMLKARLKEYGEEKVLEAIEKIRESDFLQGKTKEAFLITFDWFIKPNNFPKVLEGNYQKKITGSSGPRENPHKTKFHLKESRASKYSNDELEELLLTRRSKNGD